MFNPSREQVRQFFFDAWRKYRDEQPLEGLERIALEVMLAHPEYHAALEDPERFLARDYVPEDGQANPFLHMSLQLAIDQQPGIRTAFERILARRGDRHDALHAALECLGEIVWRAQRDRAVPDGEAYLECLRRQ